MTTTEAEHVIRRLWRHIDDLLLLLHGQSSKEPEQVEAEISESATICDCEWPEERG